MRHAGTKILLRASWALVALGLLARLLASFYFIGPNGAPSGPVSEDAFLSLQVAYNIADGRGVTVEGERTNGFQPLWVLLLAGLQTVLSLSKPGLARLALALGALFSFLTALVVRRIVQNEVSAANAELLSWLAAGIFMADGLLSKYSLNGLETSMYLFTLSLLMWATYRWLPPLPQQPSLRGMAGLGACLGLAFWARNDALLLAPILALFIAVRARPKTFAQGLALLRCELAYGSALLLVGSPWIAWNLYVSGTIQPQSGVVHSLFTGEPTLSSLLSYYSDHSYLFAHLTAWLGALTWSPLFYVRLGLANAGLLWLQGFCGLAVAFTLVIVLRVKGENGRQSLLSSRLLPFVLFLPALATTYLTYLSVRWFWDRYHAPFTLIGLVLTMVVLDRLPQALERLATLRVRTSLLAALTLSGHLLGTAMLLQPKYATDSANHFMRWQWLRDHVPAHSTVCSLQTGVLGYYGSADFQILNSDGKVSLRALEARLEPGALPPFIAANCDYFVEWRFALDRDELAPLRTLCEPFRHFEDPERDLSTEVLRCSKPVARQDKEDASVPLQKELPSAAATMGQPALQLQILQ